MTIDLFEILACVNVNVISHVILGYVNFKCRRGLIDKLVENCSEDIDRNEMVFDATFCDSLIKKVCKSCMLYAILLIIVYMIIMTLMLRVFIFIGI